MEEGKEVEAISKKRGRPKKSFDQLSVVSQRQNTKKIRLELSTDELAFATEMSFKAAGHLNAAKVVKRLRENPVNGTCILDAYEKPIKIQKYSNEEALALFADLGQTTRKYELMYRESKIRGASLYPSYHGILAAKSDCYPPKEHMKISETGFSINLQAIIDINVNRLFETLNFSFDQLHPKLTMIWKWGFDGASSQSQYKQRFESSYADDSCIFMASIVPILVHIENEPKKVVWKNIKPSSTKLCRPLRLEFQKETEEYTIKTDDDINKEISTLKNTIVINEDRKIEVSHSLFCTMLDGKVCNVLTATKSHQICYICGATPKEMNNLNLVAKKHPKKERYKYGMSTLHAWIRFLEYVLKVSYNMKFKKWSARQPAHKAMQKERKKEIQEEFRQKTGLRIGFVKQGNGTSNDGNTARKFFRNYELSAEITGFDKDLLKRFAVILQVISSGHEINVNEFAAYSLATARKCIDRYGWYYLPATVHKILIHGSEIIDFALVPIGMLSEEVQESRHKEVRRFREHNTRKTSREKTNEDLLHLLLITSDPVISSLRKVNNTKKLPLFSDSKKLLLGVVEDSDDE